MDGSPLDEAYTASKHADAAVRAGDFAKAAAFYAQSADAFERVAEHAAGNPAVSTIQALAGQCRARSHYFGSGKALEDSKKSAAGPARGRAGPAPQAAAAASAASPQQQQQAAAAPQQAAAHSNVNASVLGAPTLSQSAVAGPLSEAVSSLVMRSAATFARTFEQCLAGKGVAVPNISSAPTESFYLVRPKPGKHEDEDAPSGRVTISTLERAQALEQATKAQRSVLKAGLHQIRLEMAQKEQQIQDEHTEEVDRLRAENDRLRIQVSKLKSRWEDLKESARKRQG